MKEFLFQLSSSLPDVNQTSPLRIVDTERGKWNAKHEGEMILSGENIDIPSCPCPNDNCTCLESLNNTDNRDNIETCLDSASGRRKYCYEPLEVGPCPEGYRLEVTEVQKVNEEWNTTETVEELRCKALFCPLGSVKLSDGTCVVKADKDGRCPPGWYPLRNHSGIVECECEFYRVYSPGDGQCHKLYTQGPCEGGRGISFIKMKC